jgi:hypothetical protein
MSASKDITGQRFGQLTVLAKEGKAADNHTTWRCLCDCGNETVVARNNLGSTKSCGCTRYKRDIEDLTGMRFTRLVVLKLIEEVRPISWLCRCDCGMKKVITGDGLRSSTKSCGCLGSTGKRGLPTKHGASHPSSPLYSTYRTWMKMYYRCNNKRAKYYKYYGGRGISIDPRWNTFEAFVSDMGVKPDNMSIDRIDNDGNYCKENCRWATAKEQNNNNRNNRLITYNGKTQNMTQWAQETGLSVSAIRQRLKNNWTVHEALTSPPRTRRKKRD